MNSPTGSAPSSGSEDARKNRDHWNRKSERWQATVGESLNASEPVWGVWSIPESQLQVLGPVRDKDVLDFGCGAAQWAIHLAQLGARPVGLDNSPRQLEHAKRLMDMAGVDFPLDCASAHQAPLPDATFDIVLSDHGAITFVSPDESVGEATRLLRPGGILSFNVSSPFRYLCDDGSGWPDDRLHRGYFEMGRHEDDSGQVFHTLTYAEWLRLFRENGLEVEDLIEYRPPADASPCFYCSTEWARRWPAENIWKIRKRP